MVSFWPWRRDDSSPASFEKTLSALSGKISKQATTLDSRRNQARRVRALWTLYAVIGYLVYLVVAVLVVGWRVWGAVEYGVSVGGPFVIYGVRRALDAAFGYRVGAAEARLQDLKGQRDKTIAQLKEATRYDSTQALLDKYAGEKGEKGARRRNKAESSQDEPSTPVRRQDQKPRTTGFAPPPTANIPGRQSLPAHFSPGWHGPASGQPSPDGSSQGTPQRDPLAPSASFAPNAFPGSPQQEPQSQSQSQSQKPRPLSPPQHRSPLSQQMSPPASPLPQSSTADVSSGGGGGGAWYDRLLDVLLGDDEAAARNRLALLCTSCGLVNGLAPPGTKTPGDLGRWRCSGCGAWNGVAKENPSERKTRKPKRRDTMDAVVQEIRDATGASPDEIRRRMGDIPVMTEGDEEESDRTVYTDEEIEDIDGEEGEEGEDEVEEEEDDEDEEESPPAKATRAQKAKSTSKAATPAKASGRAKKGKGSKAS